MYIEAKSILQNVSPKNRWWFGAEFNMNIYRGCSHGCIYCDSRSDCYGIKNFDKIQMKKDAVSILQSELARKRVKGVVSLGAMSDSYNPLEKTQMLTRQSLQLLCKYGFGAAVATKSNLILRDIDVLEKLSVSNSLIVKLSITCGDDKLAASLEPHASSTSERFKAIEALSRKSIFSGVLMMPLLPYINDTKKNISSILSKANSSGAKFVYPSFGVTLRDKQREHYYQKIDKLFPGLSKKYNTRFAQSYSCNSPNQNELYYYFASLAKQYGLLYKMREIVDAYKKKPANQLSLF